MLDRGLKGSKGFTLVESRLVLVSWLAHPAVRKASAHPERKVKKSRIKESLTALLCFYDKYNISRDTNVAPTDQPIRQRNDRFTGTNAGISSIPGQGGDHNGSYDGTANSVPKAYGSWMRIEYIAHDRQHVSITLIPTMGRRARPK
jgi:hypothetical protein